MPRQTSSPARRLLAPLAALCLALAACDGDTLYDGGGPTEPGPPTGPGGGSRGTLVPFPSGVQAVGDLVVDQAGRRLFLSNRGGHRVEVLEMPSGGSPAFGTAIPVGSEPWGMGLSVDRDTLIVANSGGANISFVPLRSSPPGEDLPKRFQIPRARLFQFDFSVRIDSVANDTVITIRLDRFSYADRPQHVAQDRRGRLLYSAISTQAAPIGTIRLAERQPGWSTWDSRFLFADGHLTGGPPTSDRAIQAADSADMAIANVDSVYLDFAQNGPFRFPTARIQLFDHRPGLLPGDPNRPIQNDFPMDPVSAVIDLFNKGSDVIAYPGHTWNLPTSVQAADTTFVAASEDNRWIAFGEAGDSLAGRIMLWEGDADQGDLSYVGDIEDLTNNTADRMTGIGLNADGSLGIARGTQATYFFGRDLRLQGLARTDPPGGAGAALRPGSTGESTLAFIGTGRGTVQVLETTHYTPVGEIGVRAGITGPLKVGPPLPEQTACPADYTQGQPSCVVARVYGVTAGGVLVLDVLRSDLR